MNIELTPDEAAHIVNALSIAANLSMRTTVEQAQEMNAIKRRILALAISARPSRP